jgi:hypothetical protein
MFGNDQTLGTDRTALADDRRQPAWVPGRGRFRGRWSRLVMGAAAGLSAASLFGFLAAAPAGAVVANNGVNVAHTNVDGTGCQVVVGDQASPVRAAIGEVDVTRCAGARQLVVRVYLDHAAYYNGPLKTVAEYQASVAGTQLDAWTNGLCGYHSGSDYWITYADVSFNGGQTWSGLLGSNYAPFSTGC